MADDPEHPGTGVDGWMIVVIVVIVAAATVAITALVTRGSGTTKAAHGEATASSTTTTASTTTEQSGGACTDVWPPNKNRCNFSPVSYIVGANGYPYVDSNIWTNKTGYRQTLTANAPNDWDIAASANTNFGGVQAFPNTGFSMTGAVDSDTSVTSSWNVTLPKNQTTAGWATYDLWFNNWTAEVQIHPDQNVPSNGDYDCKAVATATFGGMPWHLCIFGSERVWKPGTDDNNTINQASGSVDILTMLQWMETNRYLPAGSSWTAASFGFEVCDTGGVTETFTVNNFTWNSAS